MKIGSENIAGTPQPLAPTPVVFQSMPSILGIAFRTMGRGLRAVSAIPPLIRTNGKSGELAVILQLNGSRPVLTTIWP